MGTIAVAPTFAGGENPSASKMNLVSAAANYWAAPPNCRVLTTSTNAIATSFAAIAFESESWDIVPDGDSAAHSTSTNNSRIYARVTGTYEVMWNITTSAGSSISRLFRLYRNGSAQTTYTVAIPAITGTISAPFTSQIALTAGDYVEVYGMAGSSGVTLGGSSTPSTFEIRLISQ